MNRRLITSIFSHLFIVLEILNHLPLWGKRLAAHILTRSCFFLLPGVQRTMRNNLAPVFPNKNKRELQRIARQIVIGYGQYFIDYFGVFFTRGSKKAEDYFNQLEGTKYIEQAIAEDNGVLVITPHLGNWELGLLLLKTFNRPVAVITAPIASGNMRRKLEQFRSTMDIEIVTLEDPTQYMFVLKRLMMQKKIVTLLVDRYVNGAFQIIPFFGKVTKMPTGYLHIARMFGCPIVPCFIIRNETGQYSCFGEAPIHVSHEGDRGTDIHNALDNVIKVFEKYIHTYALQWYRYTPVWEETT